MSNKQIDALVSLSTMEANDLLLVYDIDEAGIEKTKNMTYSDFETQISGAVHTGFEPLGTTHDSLYYLPTGSKVIEGVSSGAKIYDRSGDDPTLTFASDGDVSQGYLQWGNGGTLRIRESINTQDFILCNANAAVELYYAGTKSLATQTQGIIVNDTSGNTPAIEMRNYLGSLQGRIIGGTTSNTWQVGSSNETGIKVQNNGSVELYYNDTKAAETVGDTNWQGISIGGEGTINIYDYGETTAFIEVIDRALYIDSKNSTATAANMFLRVDNAAGSIRNGIAINGGSNVGLYYNGNLSMYTKSTGIVINDPGQATTTEIYNADVGGDFYIVANTLDAVTLFYARDAALNERYCYMDSGNNAFRPHGNGSMNLGTSGSKWQDVWATTGTIQTSDEREKENITNSDLGLDFINDLNPVSYKFKDTDYEYISPVTSGTVSGTQTFIRTHYGLIAQDVLTTLNGLGKTTEDFAGYIRDADEDVYAIRYHEFIAPVIKSIQELSDVVNSLQSRIEALESA